MILKSIEQAYGPPVLQWLGMKYGSADTHPYHLPLYEPSLDCPIDYAGIHFSRDVVYRNQKHDLDHLVREQEKRKSVEHLESNVVGRTFRSVNNYDYQVRKLIASGGIGAVFEATCLADNRKLAIKFPLKASVNYQRIAVNEMTAMSKLGGSQNRIFMPLYDAGEILLDIYENPEVEWLPFFVMPFLTTSNLGDEHLPCNSKNLILFMADLADALDEMHVKGYAHGDLKLSSIFFSKEGRPILSDLGGAYLLSGDSYNLSFTRANAPPERIISNKNNSLGIYSDLFSFGHILYKLTAGIPPYNPGTALEYEYQVCNKDRPISPIELNPNITPRLNCLIMALLETDVALRREHFQNAQSVADELRNIAREFTNRHHLFATYFNDCLAA